MNEIFNSNDNIGIIANDAGAANLINSWISNNKLFRYFFCLSGPALKVFEGNDLCDSIIDLDKLIEICNVIITGTSYSNKIEHNARIKSKNLKIKSIAVIDHWVNYERRFIRDGKKVLPDTIWVFDSFAERKARDLFKTIEIKKQTNFYVKDLSKKISFLEKKFNKKTHNILYVLEPIRKNKLDGLFYEYIVLDFFIKQINKLNLKEKSNIRLRLHPSENNTKYDKWIKNQNKKNISISSEKDLCEDIAWSTIVIGYESYALVVANACFRRCFSSKLPNDENCRLMIKDLEYLRDLE